MKIDPKTPIRGFPPAKLKKLLARERFSSIDAMKDLQVREPAASLGLRSLASDGWIKFVGIDRGDIERWETDEIGRRLVATRLIKRFPIKEGVALLPSIIAKAQALNAEPRSSRRIKSIWLFGSVLTGKPEDFAGDIDLVVNISRRPLPEPEIEALEAVEMSRAPQRAQMGWFRDFRETELLRQIKKVSHRISIHSSSDVEIFGLPYREIYRFHLETDRAGTPKGDGVGEGIDRDNTAQKKAQAAPPIPIPPWPQAPNEAVSMRDPVDLEGLLVAQHLYVRGCDAKSISARARLSENGVRAYLSRLSDPSHLEQADPVAQLDTLLKRTDPNMGIYLEAGAGRDGKQRVTVSLLAPDTLKLRSKCNRFAKNDAYFWGDPTQFDYLKVLTEAAWAYVERVFGSAVGIERSVTKFRSGRDPQPLHVPPPQDLSHIRRLLIELAQRIRASCSDWDESDSVKIDFAAHRPITHVHGSRYDGDYRQTNVRKGEAPELWEAIRALRNADDGLFAAGFHLVLGASVED